MTMVTSILSSRKTFLSFALAQFRLSTVFVKEVAADQFVRVIAFGLLGSVRASFWLDKITRKLVECFNEDFPKPELNPRLNR